MDIFLKFLACFGIGGLVCLIGQFIVNKTKITTARILVTFLLVGAFLEAVGAFKYIENVAGAGITVPITGYGANLARGAKEGAKEGLLQAVAGGLSAGAAGLTAAIFFGFIFALIFKSHSKKL